MKTIITFAITFGFLVSALFGTGYAEDSTLDDDIAIFEAFAGQDELPPQLAEKIAELEALRERDPEAFQAVLEQKRHQVRERLETLRTEDPERFQALAKKHRTYQHHYMRQLREKDPEKFEQLMQEKQERMHARLETLKETDPEKYAEITARKKAHQDEFFSIMEKDYPAAYTTLIDNNPDIVNGNMPENVKAFRTEVFQTGLTPKDMWNIRSQMTTPQRSDLSFGGFKKSGGGGFSKQGSGSFGRRRGKW